MDTAILFLAFVWSLFGGRSGGAGARSPSPPSSTLPSGGGVLTSTPPWPGVVPPDLPPFPGRAWEFDEPPPPALQQRARQLVDA